MYSAQLLFSHSVMSNSFVTPWTAAHQSPLYVEFSKQEYWSGLPFPPPGDLPNPGIEPMSPASPALAGWFFTAESALITEVGIDRKKGNRWVKHDFILTASRTCKGIIQHLGDRVWILQTFTTNLFFFLIIYIFEVCSQREHPIQTIIQPFIHRRQLINSELSFFSCFSKNFSSGLPWQSSG